jgi:phytoene/squalene synthetase
MSARPRSALDWLEGELERAYVGEARHPLLVRLQSTVRACALPREPFLRLIEANRVDQRVARYDTWEQLLGYCHLSADPVGELVLGVFGAATPERVALSDRICARTGSTCPRRTGRASAAPSATSLGPTRSGA